MILEEEIYSIAFNLQDKLEHLELLDGVVIDLLKTKWDTFVKKRFYRQFYMFAIYFMFSLISYILRPGPDKKEEGEETKATEAEETKDNATHLYKQLRKRTALNAEYGSSMYTAFKCFDFLESFLKMNFFDCRNFLA